MSRTHEPIMLEAQNLVRILGIEPKHLPQAAGNFYFPSVAPRRSIRELMRFETGCQEWIRTTDQSINSAPLYRLSYMTFETWYAQRDSNPHFRELKSLAATN